MDIKVTAEVAMLVAATMIFGTDGLGLQFDNVKWAQNIGMVALCVILFSGGMDTRLDEVRPIWKPGVVLSTVNYINLNNMELYFIIVFISWVGLRGAAPIIFSTLPVVAGVEGGGLMFNVVFFVTLLSLLLQGMTISLVSRKLHLVDDE